MGKLPGFLFYPGDWLKDPELRRCSKAEKGVWIDMLAVSFECSDRGVFATGGVPWTDEEISAAIGGDTAENLKCLRELLRKGVARRNGSGAIFSARMVRDEANRAADKTRKKNQRDREKCPERVTPSVTPLSVNETVIETATLEYETKLEAFDPEKYVRRIQAVWKWPHCDYSPLVENLILKCFEAEVLTHNWPRIEAASYVTERIESIAKILVAFDDDQQKFIPSLYKLMDTKAYRSPDKDWERKGARKRSAAAVPAGRPKW
jgi:hypothetical protein